MDMRNNPLISVVVPVYGTEKYLRKCLDSILTQTYKNLEVIVVNDASSDNSEKIIKEYALSDERIKYVRHSKNKGLFQARVSGVEEATGEYIAFVDSDDYISCDYYRMLVRKAQETDADIVVADWVFEYEDGKKMFLNLDNIRIADLSLSGTEITDAFMRQRGECFSWHTVWNKLYKKSLWDKCIELFQDFIGKRNHLIMCEDVVFSSAFWFHAEKVVNVHGINYFYMQHANQSVNAGNNFEKYKKNILDVSYAFTFFEKLIKSKGLYERYEKDFYEFKGLYARRWFDICTSMPDKSLAMDVFESVFEGFEHEGTKESDHFWGKYLTELGEEYNWHEELKVNICDPKVEYVSFDVFDTLVCRPLWNPTDLFELMDTEFNKLINSTSYVSFKEIRVESESGCREQFKFIYPTLEDITIDDIYVYMNEKYNFGSEICEQLKELEIKLELKYCTTRNYGKELFELAKEAGKKVLIISDMYLTKEIIENILKKNGYGGYLKLFVSSDEKLLKGTGELYRKALKEFEIDNPLSVLHIGDNWTVDVVAAQKIGLRSYHLPKAKDIFCNEHNRVYGGEFFENIFKYHGSERDNVRGLNDFIGMRCMLAMIANKLYDRGYVTINRASDFNGSPYHVGYMALGMHLLAVADWLLKETKRKGYRTIHFVARDGWLPKKAFDIISKKLDKNVSSNYFYISRKVTAPLQIRSAFDLYSLRTIIYIFSFSPKKLINVLSSILKEDAVKNAEEICKKNYFVYDKKFTSEREYNKFIQLLISDFLSEEKIQEFNRVIKNYYTGLIDEKDAIFDIGYSARNEGIFSYLLNQEINTYYIHTNQDIAYKRAKMFNFNLHSFYDHGPAACVVLREHLFCELGPSCIAYNIDGEKVEPVFEEYDVDYKTYYVTNTIQQAALDFVNDFVDIFDEHYDELIYRKSDASMPYEYYLNHAKWIDRQMFSESSFEDDMWGGANVNFVTFWENNLKKAGSFESIKEVDATPISGSEAYSKMLQKYYDAHKKKRKTVISKVAMFWDKIVDDTIPVDEKFAKCAGNTSNLVQWDAIERILNPDIIPNWYMTNPGGFSSEDYDAFVTTNLIYIRENADLSYLNKVLEKIGDKVLLPVSVGLSCDNEKSDFYFNPDTLKVLQAIAERCKSIGVRGEYTADILAKNGIKNSRIIGCPSLYSDIKMMKGLTKPVGSVDVVSGSFKPFYGEFTTKEKQLLCYMADNGFKLNETTSFILDDKNIKESELLEQVSRYKTNKLVHFDVNTWKDSFSNVDFAMGMNFHDNVMALQSGVPALFIAYESSAREMCKYFCLPMIDISQFDDSKKLEEYYQMADYSDFLKSIDARYNVFREFLNENNLVVDDFQRKVVNK